jgi:isopenicillin-N epimerase
MDRRQFLATAAVGGAAALSVGYSRASDAQPGGQPATQLTPDSSWAAIKRQFNIAPNIVQMSSFYLASHPTPVREAIERHRRGLDEDSHSYIEQNVGRLERAVRDQASAYLAVNADELALTDSTTMGLGLVYSGMKLKAGEEILTDTRDHIVTAISAQYAADRSGASVRQTPLYADPSKVSIDEVVSNVRRNLRDSTRLLAVTWVHSGTGVKMPIAAIAEAVRAHNRGKPADKRALLSVDGVHGLGIEDVTIADLGPDFFIAGTHKWLTGPRGTGLVWAKRDAWQMVQPTIPTFDPMWRPPPIDQMPLAGVNTPGGFHTFEHRWAVAEAFAFHRAIGKARIAARIHELNSMAKSAMAKMPKIKVHTPLSPKLSAGIIAFEVAGMTPDQAVEKLHHQGIIASVTPGFYTPRLARVAPSLVTLEDDVDRTMRAIAAL